MKVREIRPDANRDRAPAPALFGQDGICRIIATSDDDTELDHSRPVPWDWPEAESPNLA